MTVFQKIKLARMGNKEARGLLVRDRNKIVATAAVRSPKITENEVAGFAKARNVSDEVMRIIARNREWTRNYKVKLALATNPKCPQADRDQVPELPAGARAARHHEEQGRAVGDLDPRAPPPREEGKADGRGRTGIRRR